MPRIQTSTITLDSIQLGEGPDVVLSHGLAANQAFWYFQMAPVFAREHRVTLYDLRGHGNSELTPSGYSTRDLAEDLRGLLDARGIERADLVGHSYGGAVSLHFCALYPDRARSLTMLDSRLHALQPFNSPDDQAYWDGHRERLQARVDQLPPGIPRWLMPMLEEFERARDQDPHAPGMLPGAQPRSGGIWDPNLRSSRRWLRLLRETTFLEDLQNAGGLTAERLAAMSTPTLLLYGENSLMIKTFRKLEQLLPRVRARVMAGAGHFFPLVTPNRVTDAVMPFLRDPDGAVSL